MAAKYTAEDAIQMLDESFETANTDSDYEEGGDNSGASDSTHSQPNPSMSHFADSHSDASSHSSTISDADNEQQDDSGDKSEAESTPKSRYGGTRKRVKRTETWKRSLRKKLRNTGQGYTTQLGKKVSVEF